MATLGLSKVFILDKYFTELQKFWETEKKLQGIEDCSRRRLFFFLGESGAPPPPLSPEVGPFFSWLRFSGWWKVRGNGTPWDHVYMGITVLAGFLSAGEGEYIRDPRDDYAQWRRMMGGVWRVLKWRS